MNKHKSNKIKENSNTVRHLIMGQIITTQNLVAIKEVRHAGQWQWQHRYVNWETFVLSHGDVIMSSISSQITCLTIVYSTVYSDADLRKHQSSASLAFVWGIHRGPVNSPLKWPVTRKMFPFDDVIMVRYLNEWTAVNCQRGSSVSVVS